LEQSNWINEINDQKNLEYNEKFKKNNDIDHQEQSNKLTE
jgi:hypothetical protein